MGSQTTRTPLLSVWTLGVMTSALREGADIGLDGLGLRPKAGRSAPAAQGQVGHAARQGGRTPLALATASRELAGWAVARATTGASQVAWRGAAPRPLRQGCGSTSWPVSFEGRDDGAAPLKSSLTRHAGEQAAHRPPTPCGGTSMRSLTLAKASKARAVSVASRSVALEVRAARSWTPTWMSMAGDMDVACARRAR